MYHIEKWHLANCTIKLHLNVSHHWNEMAMFSPLHSSTYLVTTENANTNTIVSREKATHTHYWELIPSTVSAEKEDWCKCIAHTAVGQKEPNNQIQGTCEPDLQEWMYIKFPEFCKQFIPPQVELSHLILSWVMLHHFIHDVIAVSTYTHRKTSCAC